MSALTAIARRPHLAVAAFSAAMLAAALAFEHLGGMAPCRLCWGQRWAHVAALALALVAPFLPGRAAAATVIAAALALLAGAGVALYHVGVEQHWWATSCAVDLGGATSLDALREMLLSAPTTRCDEVPWQMLGISMAGWNGIASAAVGVAALLAAGRGLARPGG